MFYEVIRSGVSSARTPKQNPPRRVTGIARDNIREKCATALMYATAFLPRALCLFADKIAFGRELSDTSSFQARVILTKSHRNIYSYIFALFHDSKSIKFLLRDISEFYLIILIIIDPFLFRCFLKIISFIKPALYLSGIFLTNTIIRFY